MSITKSIKKRVISLLITVVCINIFSSETNGFLNNSTEDYRELTLEAQQETQNNKPEKTEIHQFEKSIIPHTQKQLYIPEHLITQYSIEYKEQPIIFSYFHHYAESYADLVGIIKIVI